jgi:hypothetical protein
VERGMKFKSADKVKPKKEGGVSGFFRKLRRRM